MLTISGLRFRSLYDGAAAAKHIKIAPYLTTIDPTTELLEAMLEEASGQSWGIYLLTTVDRATLRRHLRKFIKVELEGFAKAVFFRYYDPRVLREFLPTCPEEQLERFFGPIDCFLCEDPDGKVQVFRRDDEGRLEVFPVELLLAELEAAEREAEGRAAAAADSEPSPGAGKGYDIPRRRALSAPGRIALAAPRARFS